MHIFYTPDIQDDQCVLPPEEAKHCLKVLRLRVGEEVLVTDGNGKLFTGNIEEIGLKVCRIRIIGESSYKNPDRYYVTLAVAPTKNMDRTEWMLEKCTEIGIDKIILLKTEHSERKSVNEERLMRVMVSAMKQSLKGKLPELDALISFRDFIDNCTIKNRFIAHCHPGEKRRLEEIYIPGEEVVILIGPEGDFSEEEVDYARSAGFIPVTLGKSRLRTETAGVAACHSINFLNKN